MVCSSEFRLIQATLHQNISRTKLSVQELTGEGCSLPRLLRDELGELTPTTLRQLAGAGKSFKTKILNEKRNLFSFCQKNTGASDLVFQRVLCVIEIMVPRGDNSGQNVSLWWPIESRARTGAWSRPKDAWS
jgi:hypothetical protein